MSAFLCSRTHVAAICAWASTQGLTEDPVNLAITLRRLNNAALAARSGDPAEPLEDIGPALRQQWAQGVRSNPQARALVECLSYQCGEGDVMQAHPDRAVLLGLLEACEKLAPAGPAPNVWAV